MVNEEVKKLIAEGTALYTAGKFAEALQALEKAIELDPHHVNALNNRSVILNQMGRHTEALQVIETAIELRENDAGLWINKGVALNNLDRDFEAIMAFEKAISIDENDPVRIWYDKGVALRDQGKIEEAIEAYHNAAKASILKRGNKPIIGPDGKAYSLPFSEGSHGAAWCSTEDSPPGIQE
jgi:Flp pilus assembly protein TadD